MKTIITVQHTQSVHHTNGMVGSWTDWELTELGLAQAEKIGRKLKSELDGESIALYSDAESRRDEWNRLAPFFDEIMSNGEKNIIVVSHGDLLSVLNTMFMGLGVESINTCEMFGLAGGVSYMFENDEGKRFIKRISDMSYML